MTDMYNPCAIRQGVQLHTVICWVGCVLDVSYGQRGHVTERVSRHPPPHTHTRERHTPHTGHPSGGVRGTHAADASTRQARHSRCGMLCNTTTLRQVRERHPGTSPTGTHSNHASRANQPTNLCTHTVATHTTQAQHNTNQPDKLSRRGCDSRACNCSAPFFVKPFCARVTCQLLTVG